ncbi:NADH pyrophosphatase [Vibrio mimicus VM573]|nr:NADH pyrophosphatase [Vibrio mimicus VM573]
MEKSDGKNAYWCVVSGSDIWLVDGQVPFGSAQQWDLPLSNAIFVDHYQNSPVYWLNAADLEQDRPLSSLRELLGVDEALFLAASKAVQYGHMSRNHAFLPTMRRT